MSNDKVLYNSNSKVLQGYNNIILIRDEEKLEIETK